MRALFLLALGLTACAERVSEQKQEYGVTRSGVGKRFLVDLKNTTTGEAFTFVDVAAECPALGRAKKGSRWQLTEATFRRDDGTEYRKVEGLGQLCSRGRGSYGSVRIRVGGG